MYRTQALLSRWKMVMKQSDTLCHLIHNVSKYTKIDETKVMFNLTDQKDKSDSDESAVNAKAEGRKVRRRRRPKKEDNESEAYTSDTTPQGISSRT